MKKKSSYKSRGTLSPDLIAIQKSILDVSAI